jgi:hypothetical protein
MGCEDAQRFLFRVDQIIPTECVECHGGAAHGPSAKRVVFFANIQAVFVGCACKEKPLLVLYGLDIAAITVNKLFHIALVFTPYEAFAIARDNHYIVVSGAIFKATCNAPIHA